MPAILVAKSEMSDQPGGIFVNYRREDTAQAAGRLADRLRERFGSERVFIDVESIGLGLEFAEVITKAVGSCDLLFALIGKEWLTAADDEGRRRLDDEHDWVRLEIEAALQRKIRVVPVLIDDARMPRLEEVPSGLHALLRRQVLKLSHEDFTVQASHLIEKIAPLLPWAPPMSKSSSTPAANKGPQVTVLRKTFYEFSLCLFLEETHRIEISVADGVHVDGTPIKGDKFVVQDGQQRISGSCVVSQSSPQSSWAVQLDKVILVLNGVVVGQWKWEKSSTGVRW